MKGDTTHGLSPQLLAPLFPTGVECMHAQSNPGPGRSPEKILQNMLSAELPFDPAIPDSLPAVLNWPSDQVLAVAGRPVSDLLLNSGTDLTVLETLKDYTKELARRGGPEAKQAAATVIYYAAIASALVFIQRKITQHSYEKLHQAYVELEQKPWIPAELKRLFRKARALCGSHRDKPG